jgi:hypothetical protein
MVGAGTSITGSPSVEIRIKASGAIVVVVSFIIVVLVVG